MAVLALTTAARVEVVEMFESLTLIAQEAIIAGAPIAVVPSSTGAAKFVNSDANGAAHLATVAGIATVTVAAGQACTAMKRGIMDGFVLTDQAYFAPIYVSDTVGILGDAAGTGVLQIGRVVPSNANPPITVAADKLLWVDISYIIDTIV